MKVNAKQLAQVVILLVLIASGGLHAQQANPEEVHHGKLGGN